MAGEYKNTNAPVGSSERTQAIPLKHKTLRSMTDGGASAIRTEIAISGHERYLPSLVSGSKADLLLNQVRASQPKQATSTTNPTKVETLFARGEIVRDVEKKKRVTILKANIGTTGKGWPIHLVADKHGNSWKQSERKLEKI